MCAVRAGHWLMVMVRDTVCMTLRGVANCASVPYVWRNAYTRLRITAPASPPGRKYSGTSFHINASPIRHTARRPGHRGAHRTALHAAGA